MADVYAVFGTLLALGIVFPGMLTAWWLLFPEVIDRARTRVVRTPWRTFFMGVAVAVSLSVPIGILFALPFGPAKFFAAVLLMGLLGIASFGAAGIAAAMAAALRGRTDDSIPPGRAFLAGAVALELAAAFPGIGWFLVIPLTLITSLGAAVLALLGWQASPEPGVVPEAVPTHA